MWNSVERMCHTKVDLPELPASTEDIRHALAEVEAKLSAWVAAMTEAQAALLENAAVAAAPAEPAVSPDPVSAVESPAVAAEPGVVEEPVAPSEPVIPPPAEDPKPIPPAAVTPQIKPKKPEPPPSPSRSVSDEEDEALLASLGPETAKAIRIMRRLSAEKKSVRELLEEYAHTRSDQDPGEGRKKSWWSRG